MLMPDLKTRLQAALARAALVLGEDVAEVPLEEVPQGKPGDFGTPLAFNLARTMRDNPVAIARQLADTVELPEGIARAEAVGPYLNFFVDAASFVRSVAEESVETTPVAGKVIVEHTSVNPNKEAHVGHLRNICLGDACARILRAAGRNVEVQNYVDDTGRQAAESLCAVRYFGARFGGGEKYDHWLGRLYVRLGEAKQTDGEAIELSVQEMMHELERGELRGEVERVVRAQLETYWRLGAEYDLLVWESDVVTGGFLDRGLKHLRQSEHVFTPQSGKYAGALVMDVSGFIPGLEEPHVVLVRSDGNAVYVAKDIGYHYWKAGLFEGLVFSRFAGQPSGTQLYTSASDGESRPDGREFAHGETMINVIDVRQSHPQAIVQAALRLADGTHDLRHLAYEVVTLEGQAMSGRKGITLSIDEVMDEAANRARAVITEKNPELADAESVAEQVGIGALRFGMLKSEAKRVIDFRWERALSLQGDSAPYVQYAHARAASILRAARREGAATSDPDWGKVGRLEVKLAQVTARLPEVTRVAALELAPHLVAQYALELATAWNTYYNHKDERGRYDTQVLKAEPGLKEARLALVAKVKATLAQSLHLLGIAAPEEM